MSKQHALNVIAASAARPVGKAKDRRTTEATEGIRFARDVIEAAQAANETWLARALVLAEATKQFRAAALECWTQWRDELRESALAMHSKEHKGKALGAANAANVRVNELARVASAFNSGASMNGLAAYMEGLPGHPALSYGYVLAYARTFSDSKAGRPVNSTLQNLVGFIVREGKRDNLTPEDRRVLESLTQWAQGLGAKFK